MESADINWNGEIDDELHCEDSGFILMCDEMMVQGRHETEGMMLALEDVSLESKGKLESENLSTCSWNRYAEIEITKGESEMREK